MPIHRGTTTKEGKRCGYYQFGEKERGGKKYCYPLGNERARKLALAKAKKQGRAIESSKHSR